MINYWVDQLSPPCPGLGLPTRQLGPSEVESARAMPYAGATERFPISREFNERTSALAKQLGVTPFSVFLAGFYLLMHTRTGRSDLVVSVPVMNRPRSCMNVFGCFAKQVPYRLRFADDLSFADLVRRVRDVNRGAHANEAAPVLKAVARLGLHHAPQAAIGKAIFIYQNSMVPRVDAGGVSFEMEHRWDLLDFAREDMVWQLVATTTGFDCWIEYRTALYTASFVQGLATDYFRILDRATVTPAVSISTIRLLNAAAGTPITE
jgi:non-ribosomal peptide synthetase component F